MWEIFGQGRMLVTIGDALSATDLPRKNLQQSFPTSEGFLFRSKLWPINLDRNFHQRFHIYLNANSKSHVNDQREADPKRKQKWTNKSFKFQQYEKKKINKMQIKIVLAGKSLVYGTIKKLTFVAKL
jgi:hypothetical protein